MPGLIPNFEEAPVAIVESKTPPILIHPMHLGGDKSAGKLFTVGVRIKTDQVSEYNNYYFREFVKLNYSNEVPLKALKLRNLISNSNT